MEKTVKVSDLFRGVLLLFLIACFFYFRSLNQRLDIELKQGLQGKEDAAYLQWKKDTGDTAAPLLADARTDPNYVAQKTKIIEGPEDESEPQPKQLLPILPPGFPKGRWQLDGHPDIYLDYDGDVTCEAGGAKYVFNRKPAGNIITLNDKLTTDFFDGSNVLGKATFELMPNNVLKMTMYQKKWRGDKNKPPTNWSRINKTLVLKNIY